MTPGTDLSPEDEAALHELNEDLAGLKQSEWQPRIAARAFTSRHGHAFTLTMQGWINLDFVKSPLLLGKMPEEIAELEEALAAFGHEECKAEGLEPEEAAVLARRMRAAVGRAFATALRMRHPDAGSRNGNDGFGEWLPVFAFLIHPTGMSRTEALACPVEQAFAIIAALRHNEGWMCEGENYSHLETEEQHGAR